jgi:hypothetical protein
MSEDLSKSLKDLAIEQANDVIVATILKSDATILESIQDVSKILHKELANDKEPTGTWKALVNFSYPKEKADFIFHLIEKDPVVKQSFVAFVNTHEEVTLAQLYNALLTHSDTQFKALLLSFTTIRPDLRLKFVDLALENLKAAKDKSSKLTELQLVSRYYLHLTKDTTPAPFFRSKTISIVSVFADRRLNHDIISQVVMILSKMSELDEDTLQRDLVSVVEDYLLEDSNNSLIIAFSLTALLFHINQNLGFSVFTIDRLLKQDYDQNHFFSEQVVTAALDLLSSACVNKESRAQVKANFLPIVKKALQSSKKSVVILAASILVKTNYVKEMPDGDDKKEEIDILSLSLYFEDEIATGENIKLKDIYGSALEGLAYTSLLPEVKARIISNQSIVNALVKIVSDHYDENPWVFCALSTLSNLTSYAPKISQEQQKLNKLKDYANRNEESKTSAEPDSVVASRCKVILNTSILDALSQHCPRLTLSSRNTAAVLLRNLASEKKDRAVFAQKGGLTVLLYLILPTDKPDHYGNKHRVDDKHLNIALSGLARTLISIDPSLALSSKLTPTVTVNPLVSQLQNESSDVPLLDTFEALLALTNIASIDDACRNLIIRSGWAKIELLTTSSNAMVQRATVELLCNLAASPLCAEKYLDDTAASNSRLEILAALTDLDDLTARTAATGALAMLSEWGPAPGVMYKSKRLLDRLLGIIAEETSNDIIIRALVVVQNLVVSSLADRTKNPMAEAFLQELKARDLDSSLKKLVAKNKDVDIAGICSEVSKSLSGV